MKKTVNYLMLALIAAVWCAAYLYPWNRSSISEEEKIVNKIEYDVAQKVKKELSLIPFGSGAQMMHGISKLSLAFECRRPIDIAESRKMLVYATSSLMEAVNSNEKIRPYLYRYPFTAWNVGIEIIIHNEDGRNVDLGELCIVVAKEGDLFYKTDSIHPNSLLETVHKETYKEALEIIQNEEPHDKI